MNKRDYLLGLITGLFIMGCLTIVFLGLQKFGSSIQLPFAKSNPTGFANLEDKMKSIDRILDAKYYEAINEDELFEGAYKGFVSGIGDPYTSYFSKDQFSSFQEDTAGSYEGIGVVVTFGENGTDIEVLSPFAGSPGEKAGVMQGDRILKVNGVDILGMSLEEAVDLIKGPKGTPVTLTVQRKLSDTTVDINIVRDVIDIETVSHKILDNQIGYMNISGFQEVTYDQFMEAYKDLEAKGQRGMIIDLRNNPGGLVSIVSEITDELLKEGLIVYTEDKNGRREEIFSDEERSFDKPLIILVNEYSASASEILAGAVKDHNAGLVVGTTTYGKGLVQGTYALDDGSAIKVTIAKYYTPSGNYINEIGIEPDIKVELPEEYKNQFSVEEEMDTQLKEAIKIMGGKLSDE